MVGIVSLFYCEQDVHSSLLQTVQDRCLMTEQPNYISLADNSDRTPPEPTTNPNMSEAQENTSEEQEQVQEGQEQAAEGTEEKPEGR